jgi:hypothetical protein
VLAKHALFQLSYGPVTAIVGTGWGNPPPTPGDLHDGKVSSAWKDHSVNDGHLQGDESPYAGRDLDVELAEFNALRAESVVQQTAQATLVGVGLTALGVVFGLAVKQGGDNHLFLAVPPLAAIISLIHASVTFRIIRIGDYIRDELWPAIQVHVGPVPSWQAYLVARRQGRNTVVQGLLNDGPGMVLMAVASVAAVAAVDNVALLPRLGGVLCTVVTFIAPFLPRRASQFAIAQEGEGS